MASLRSPRPGFGFRPYAWPGDPLPLRLLPGPQASAEALAALLRAAFTVTRADRMGVHLDGPPVPGGDVLSEPTPLGAVQVTSGGAPILLLNDRGTLGGYSKPAIIHPGDLPRVAQLRPGERLRFVALAR
jgi:allophanate hydrolase subunit 2